MLVPNINTYGSEYSSHTLKNYSLREINSSDECLYSNVKNINNGKFEPNSKLNHKLVKSIKYINLNHVRYVLVTCKNHKLGWIKQIDLVKPKEYILSRHYISQLYPLYAPEACEATSLKMGLDATGYGSKYSLAYIINHMPLSSKVTKGFTGNPYNDDSGKFFWLDVLRHGFNLTDSQTIFPKPLANYAKRYDRHAKDVTGISYSKLISEIKRGHSLVFVGTFQMQSDNSSYHVLTILGYKKNHLLVADPYRYYGQGHKVFWVGKQRFIHVFYAPNHNRRAVLL